VTCHCSDEDLSFSASKLSDYEALGHSQVGYILQGANGDKPDLHSCSSYYSAAIYRVILLFKQTRVKASVPLTELGQVMRDATSIARNTNFRSGNQ